MSKFFVIAALLSTTFALEERTITYNENLKCGGCIAGGYTFCVEGAESIVVQAGGSPPNAKCCQGSGCDTYTSNASWSCSSAFTDKDNAITNLCPQRQDKCGDKQSVEFSKEGDTTIVEPKDMSSGESCTYKVKSSCGAPGVEMKPESTATDQQVDISTMSFNSNEMTGGTTSRGGGGKPSG